MIKTKLLIFGITGDLSTRKLLPALEQVLSKVDFHELQVVGVSRREFDVNELFSKCQDPHFLDEKLSINVMDLDNPDDYISLSKSLDLQADEQLIVYMAVPPLATEQIVDLMGKAGLNGDNVKILFEKPFGVDYSSAERLISQTARYFNENQIYRIDHYLAKEMAQNVIAFRGRNAIFSDIWNNRFIESIDVIASQQIGIEGRAQFYEQTGALRDLVQGHLMQLLVLILMNVPQDMDLEKVPVLRQEAIGNIQIADASRAVRGQYIGYKAEVDNPNSQVETFVSINLESDDERWVGVPIRLVTGKSLATTTTEIRIKLRDIGGATGNCLKFKIQPDEGVDIEVFAKKPGYGRMFESKHLSFDYSDEGKMPDAYEQVLIDAISSKKSLFTTSEEVLRSWQILQPVQDYWNSGSTPLVEYEKGSDISSILA